MKKITKEKLDTSTEEKIKEAAHTVFTRKGYVATKVRDIAAEAGINLALVNYYFRSKEKLFELIMAETIQKVLSEVKIIITDEQASLIEKVERIADHYITMLLNNPDVPLFIINETFSGSDKFSSLLKNTELFSGSHFARQLAELSTERKINIHPIHILINLMGLIVFPFLGRKVLLKAAGVQDGEFKALMEERKKLIPVWIKMLVLNNTTN